MTDIALLYDNQRKVIDIGVVDSDLLGDDGLYTAILASLYTDRQAINGDAIPNAGPNRPGDARGWWADALTLQPLGSRLWLLWREKELAVVLARARQYAREALNWLLDGGWVKNLDVQALNPARGVLEIEIFTTRQLGDSLKTEKWSLFFNYSQPRLFHEKLKIFHG